MPQKKSIYKIAAFFYVTFFCNALAIGQTVRQRAISQDWFEEDPVMDSVAGISLNKAYALLKGRRSRTVIVAVIDNGVDILHEDLKNIIWTNKKEIPGNGLDDDKNGYIDDIHGWNFRGTKNGSIVENEQAGSTQLYLAWKDTFENFDTHLIKPGQQKQLSMYLKARKDYFEKVNSRDSSDILYAYNINYSSSRYIAGDSDNPDTKYYGSSAFLLSPNLSHGTHVAGIIAAQRNNKVGINGIADNVLIMPIVATTAVGDERDRDIANAIVYAVDNGANIINMSFSKRFSSAKSIVDKAIMYAAEKNVLIVHAAGNDGANIDSDTNYHYPIAIYENGDRANNFITVGWSRPLFDYRLAHPYSDYGKLNVDLFAPGSDIYSTVPNNGYDYKSGSSMSAPVVSGVAALLMSYFPSLTARQVKEILLKSVYKPNQLVNMPQTKIQVPFDGLSNSGGIVNAYNAVKLAIDFTKSN
ncbi:MAG TPA: S8 family peptidase [Puia sp.]|jgi:subtilisin family serine protease|nr:S8 family peptidase [Puia sp.]